MICTVFHAASESQDFSSPFWEHDQFPDLGNLHHFMQNWEKLTSYNIVKYTKNQIFGSLLQLRCHKMVFIYFVT